MYLNFGRIRAECVDSSRAIVETEIYTYRLNVGTCLRCGNKIVRGHQFCAHMQPDDERKNTAEVEKSIAKKASKQRRPNADDVTNEHIATIAEDKANETPVRWIKLHAGLFGERK